MSNDHWQLPVGIMIVSAVAIPFVVYLFKNWLQDWRLARQAKLDERYLTKVEHDAHMEELAQTQAAQHQQNREALTAQTQFLDTIRTEGHVREGKLAGQIEGMGNRLAVQIMGLQQRVDGLYERRRS